MDAITYKIKGSTITQLWRTLLLLSMLPSFWSCQNEAEPSKLATEKAALQKEIKTLRSKVNELERNQVKTSKYAASIIPPLLSKTILIEKIYHQFLTDSEKKYNQILWDLSTLTNKNRFKDSRGYTGTDIDLFGYQHSSFFVHFLWTKFDRSAENIATFLSERELNFATQLAKNSYHSSGISTLAKALMLSYAEVGNNPSLLDSLYQRASTVDALFDDYYSENVVSDTVRALLKPDPTNDPLIFVTTRYNWVYTFWARRHHEGNSKTAYQLIKTLDQKILDAIAEDEYLP